METLQILKIQNTFMMRWIFIGSFILNGFTSRSQLISLENASRYIGKSVTVYGKVIEGAFNESRKRDTCTLTLLDEASGKPLLIKILPEMRAGFGYRPELALLNKLAYFSGNLQITKDVTEMYLSSPFSITFKQGEAITEPKYQPLPPQPKPKASAKSSEVTTRISARPIPETKKLVTPKEPKKEPKIDNQKVVKKTTQADEIRVIRAEPIITRQPNAPTEKPANTTTKAADTKEEKTRNVEALQKKNTAATSPYTGIEPNPNQLSAAPVVHTNSLVGIEMILKSRINLRGGPGGFFTTTGSLTKGEVIKVLSCSFDWCKVIQVNDKIVRLEQGYIKASKLKE